MEAERDAAEPECLDIVQDGSVAAAELQWYAPALRSVVHHGKQLRGSLLRSLEWVWSPDVPQNELALLLPEPLMRVKPTADPTFAAGADFQSPA